MHVHVVEKLGGKWAGVVVEGPKLKAHRLASIRRQIELLTQPLLIVAQPSIQEKTQSDP